MTKIFLDSASFDDVDEWFDKVEGFTSNPSMVAASWEGTYREYAAAMLEHTKGKSTSLEVIADGGTDMWFQALELGKMAPNVVVKIPITNAKGERIDWVAQGLEGKGIHVNVTAVFTPEQVIRGVTIVSIFCGRLSYTGRDPKPTVREALALTDAEVLWAGVRGPYNIQEAVNVGAHIVTVPPDSLKRWFASQDKTPEELSLQTVQEFTEAGSRLEW